jgi:hypothetical protein
MRLLILLLISFSALGIDLEPFKATCEEIGFIPKTEKFGECVLKLRIKYAADQRNNEDVSTKINTDNIEELKRQHQAMAQQQFEATQRQNDILQNQYNHQVAMYNQQIKAQQAERERKKNIYLMQLGGYMLQGRSFGDASRMASGLPPVYSSPQVPRLRPMQNYRVTLPNGSLYTCRYNANARRANCF